MANTYTAVTEQDGSWRIGWIAEIPGVNCQERTREALLASLRVTLTEALALRRVERACLKARCDCAADGAELWNQDNLLIITAVDFFVDARRGVRVEPIKDAELESDR